MKRSLKIICSIILFSIFTCFLDVQAKEPRLTVFISDLHMGAYKLQGDWDWYEDFWWEEEFKSFLEAMNSKGNGSTDLIINGDLFELIQSSEKDCNFDDKLGKNFGCNIDEAKRRLNSILTSHSKEIENLREFANSGDNRIVILAGNHDAALQIEEISNMVLHSINAKQGRVIIQPSGYWLSSDGKIYAEHGHQIGMDANKFEKWPNPTIADNVGKIFIQRTFGESFVQKFFNKYERKYPVIDNFNNDMTGLKYGLCAEKTEGGRVINNLFEGTSGFFEFAFFKLSKEQFFQGLGEKDTEIPAWDIDEIKKSGKFLVSNQLIKKSQKNSGNRFEAALQNNSDDILVSAWVDEASKKAPSEDGIEILTRDLSDEEISMYCYLNMKDQNIFMIKGLSNNFCPTKGKTLGALFSKVFFDERVTFKNHLEKRYEELGGAAKTNSPFEVFIYGHTHDAHGPERFDGMERPSFGSVKILNSGAWQRIVTSSQFGKIENCSRDNTKIREKLEASPRTLPSCYSFIMVEHATWPKPFLKSWHWQKETKKGEIVEFGQCN